MTEKFKIGIIHQMEDIFLTSGKQIITADDIVAISQQLFTEVGT
jgi:hypothetical protein